MWNRIGRGAGAGLLAGVVMGIGMTVMRAPAEGGGSMPMMTMVAMIVGSESLVIGWIYHLFNSALIGGVFGLVFGGFPGGWTRSLAWGSAYGFAWWILGGLILMPVLLGMAAFAPLQRPEMRMVAMGSLGGHILYGLILGALYDRFRPREPVAPETARLREREPVAP